MYPGSREPGYKAREILAPTIPATSDYCISLIKCPGVYLLTEFFDLALKRGRRLMFMFFARAKPQLVLVDEIICINSRMASQGSVSEDRHEEASVIRGHHVYKSVWTPEVGEELSLGHMSTFSLLRHRTCSQIPRLT